MVQSEPASWLIWLVIAALGLGTYAFRLSFIQLTTWIDSLPPQIEETVTFIPPAVLAALILPELFLLEEAVAGLVLTPRAFAGILGFVVAWYTRSMIATIGVGMIALWAVQGLVG